MSHLDADKHNFGQLVKPMERASFLFFRKPRPVFWEHLFFGQGSPLESLFSEMGENAPFDLASFLFNLVVEIESEWLGYSKEIKTADVPVTEQHFYSFGVLLGYTYAFGIRDLHKFNLIKTKSHLQVIDAEVVLTNLILPNETILLPFKDVPFEDCGASLLIDSLEQLSTEQRRLIFAGYFDLFAVIFKKQKALVDCLTTIQCQAPIRILVRNTRIYSNHLNGKSKIQDLLEEEQLQLERGDVPYFFKRLSDDRLYWISSENRNAASVKSLESFKSDVDRHAQPVSILLGTPEAVEKKMAQGALFLQRKLGISEAYEFSWNGGKLILSSGEFKNAFTGTQFRVGRS